MAGLVGIIAQETARYSMFAASLSDLDIPEGSNIKWWFGHDIADNTNNLVREMYRQDKDWLWIMGDDHVFSPDLLNKLLAHDKEIVVPLCLMRNPPYRPVIFSSVNTDKFDSTSDVTSTAAFSKIENRIRINLDEYPDGGLVKIHSAGNAGMLIRREVFDFMPEPWFEAGRLSSVQLAEDLFFCDKARNANFELWADLDSSLGHCTSSVVWPVKEPDGWTFAFSMMGGFELTMPPAIQSYADEVGRAPR